jgi:biopolymer transport protein ExbB/TolQ
MTASLLNVLSDLSPYLIAGAFMIHLAAFAVLFVWFRRDLRNIASSLSQFTSNLRHRSIMDSTVHLSDQIEAFLADVNEVVENPARRSDREALQLRINILDENRRYLNSLSFETCYNLCRTMIEAYPLAGVMGTVFAIGAALQNPQDMESTATVGFIIQRFGNAIWATFTGLISAVVLMFINGILEPPFTRLTENRVHVRETVAKVKRELTIAPQAGGDLA